MVCSFVLQWTNRAAAATLAVVSCNSKSCAHSTFPHFSVCKLKKNIHIIQYLLSLKKFFSTWKFNSSLDKFTASSTVNFLSTTAHINISDLIESIPNVTPWSVSKLYESKCLLMTSLALFENEGTNVDSEGWISILCFSAYQFIIGSHSSLCFCSRAGGS